VCEILLWVKEIFYHTFTRNGDFYDPSTCSPFNCVKRTLYRDDVLNVSEYPLDDKIELIKIDDKRSRYTQVFAWNIAQLYAELTEADAASAINAMLGIDIDKTQIARVAQAVAKNYIRPACTSVSTVQANSEGPEESDTENLEETAEETNDQPCANIVKEGFLSKRLRELDANPERDTIIKAAIDGKVDGVEAAQESLNVMYLSGDGTGVPGLRRELSDKGKDGGKAGTFEAKIGCTFRQGFTADGMPVLEDGNIIRMPDTTKYTGTTDKIGGFSPQFTEFAIQNGMLSAAQIAFLSDGAKWLSNMENRLCPDAIFIVDY